ncbi:SnoaL/DnrD family polyketide biosynthesis methyl ester cyclase [Streptomyces tauricus]
MSDQIASVRRLVEAYNTGKTDDVADYIHPEYMNPGTLEFTSLRGPELFAINVAWIKRTFSEDARLEEVAIEENGDWVRARLVLYGRHVGEMVGMAPTGRLFSGEQIHLLHFVDGKIHHHRDWPDYQGTYRQLGEPWPEKEHRRP